MFGFKQSNYSTSGTSLSLSSTPAAGDCLILTFSMNMSGSTYPSAVTGGGVSTWHTAFSDLYNGPSGTAGIFLAYGIVDGTPSKTVSWTNGSEYGQQTALADFSCAGTVTFDQIGTLVGGASGTSATTSTLTPTHSGELFISVVGCAQNNSAGNPSTGWNNLGLFYNNGGLGAYLIGSGTTPESCTWPIGSFAWVTNIAAFTDTAAAPPALVIPSTRVCQAVNRAANW